MNPTVHYWFNLAIMIAFWFMILMNGVHGLFTPGGLITGLFGAYWTYTFFSMFPGGRKPRGPGRWM